MIYILLVILFIWYLWFYDENEVEQLIKSLIEKDYIFMLSKITTKSFKSKFIERVVIALLIGSLAYLMDWANIMLSFALFITVYLLQYQIVKRKYNKLLKQAILEFPYLLDKLASLVQTNTIPVSINKAITSSPIIFRKDLMILVEEIHDDNTLDPYIKFARKFHQIEDIESVMRTLYSLSNVGSNKENIILTFCNLSNSKLIKRKELDMENSVDAFNIYSYFLYAMMGLLMLGLFSTLEFFSI